MVNTVVVCQLVPSKLYSSVPTPPVPVMVALPSVNPQLVMSVLILVEIDGADGTVMVNAVPVAEQAVAPWFLTLGV